MDGSIDRSIDQWMVDTSRYGRTHANIFAPLFINLLIIHTILLYMYVHTHMNTPYTINNAYILVKISLAGTRLAEDDWST